MSLSFQKWQSTVGGMLLGGDTKLIFISLYQLFFTGNKP